jgi:GNAT superfamily N-acetyltransferase
MSRWQVAALGSDPAQIESLVALFDRAGCTCFCRYWHFRGDKNEWLARCAFEPDASRDELVAAAREGHDEARGVVAIDTQDTHGTGRVVGWLKVAPAVSLRKITEQRYYRSLPSLQRDRSTVFTIGCLLVDPSLRHERIAHALVLGAIDAVRSWGGTAIEAMPRVPAAPVPDEELFTGPRAAYDAAGFVVIEGMDSYPVMRRDL